MKIGNIYEVQIIDVDNYGNGIAKIDNMVVFIKGVLLNEKIKIEIIDIKKRFAIGKLIKIITKSSNRKEILCDKYYECGGCDYLHIDYSQENEYKEKIIKNIFDEYKVNNIVYDNEWGNRNKVVFHIKNGNMGFYQKNTNELVSINKCLLVNENITNIYNMFKNIKLDELFEIMIRVTTTDEIMIVFKGNIDKKDIEYLSANDLIKSIYVNDKLVYGNSYIKENINGIIYTVNPESFMQVNPKIMIKLYDKIKEYAGYDEKLLDLYCGVGTIAIYLKDNYKSITGVEVVKKAIENANLNKKLNNISNINFICGDAEIIKNKHYDTVVVDPPRGGLSKKVITNLISINSNKIIYVSCNYKTLKRDIDLLKDKYQVKEISIFNMFPKTNSIECVTSLHRKDVISN